MGSRSLRTSLLRVLRGGMGAKREQMTFGFHPNLRWCCLLRGFDLAAHDSSGHRHSSEARSSLGTVYPSLGIGAAPVQLRVIVTGPGARLAGRAARPSVTPGSLGQPRPPERRTACRTPLSAQSAPPEADGPAGMGARENLGRWFLRALGASLRAHPGNRLRIPGSRSCIQWATDGTGPRSLPSKHGVAS